MSSYKVGIIGGSGFIGKYLARHLSNKFKVKIIDIKPPSINLGHNISFYPCDIRKLDYVKNALEDVDVVVHLAIIQIPQINKQKRLGYEVNIIGTQNVCEVVSESKRIRGMILSSTWHVIGEAEIEGIVDEKFGYRPDKVEERAKLYALSKIGQEIIVRFYNEISDKAYAIIRLGTVLGEDMPSKTAASIFIENGIKGKPITPYKHSMYRPMLYVDINDVYKAFEALVWKILKDDLNKKDNDLIINLFYPEPITILELAEIVKESIIKYSAGKIQPEIKIVDLGYKPLFKKEDKEKLKVNISKAKVLLGLDKLKSPKESIEQIVRIRLASYFP